MSPSVFWDTKNSKITLRSRTPPPAFIGRKEILEGSTGGETVPSLVFEPFGSWKWITGTFRVQAAIKKVRFQNRRADIKGGMWKMLTAVA